MVMANAGPVGPFWAIFIKNRICCQARFAQKSFDLYLFYSLEPWRGALFYDQHHVSRLMQYVTFVKGRIVDERRYEGLLGLLFIPSFFWPPSTWQLCHSATSARLLLS